MFGISATEDMDMVAQIKNEVRKLCTKSNIATQITINEADDRKHENLSRMIYENEKELKVREASYLFTAPMVTLYLAAVCFVVPIFSLLFSLTLTYCRVEKPCY